MKSKSLVAFLHAAFEAADEFFDGGGLVSRGRERADELEWLQLTPLNELTYLYIYSSDFSRLPTSYLLRSIWR